MDEKYILHDSYMQQMSHNMQDQYWMYAPHQLWDIDCMQLMYKIIFP